MYIPILIIISVLSFFKLGDDIWVFIIKQRAIISKILLVLAFLTLFLMFFSYSVKESWEKAIWLLWIVLWLPILSKVFWLKLAQKLMLFRKEIGVLMGTFTIVHSSQYFFDSSFTAFLKPDFWYTNGMITYLAWWMLATIITIILTFTSNNFSIKILWKKWKYLHRTVYFLLIFALLHVAFLQFSSEWYLDIIITFIPFIFYFIWKILEWKSIKIPLNNIWKSQ